MKRLHRLLIIAVGLAFLGLILRTGGPCVFGACGSNPTTSQTALVAGSEDQEEGRPTVPAERVSAAGIYYGHCAGTLLAVVLFPEPCGWQEHPINLASR